MRTFDHLAKILSPSDHVSGQPSSPAITATESFLSSFHLSDFHPILSYIFTTDPPFPYSSQLVQ